MKKKDLSKTELYEAVKTLVETEAPHIHLYQHKLFTLFSIAFNYMLFQSTKDPGHYIIRVEDSYLADKLIYKAKDETTRRFLEKLVLPRRLKYKASTFYLDYFHMGTWAMVNDLPKNQIKGAIIAKNTTAPPIKEEMIDDEDEIKIDVPENFFATSLMEFVPKTLLLAYELDIDGLTRIEFPFIKKQETSLSGVKIVGNFNIDDDY